MIIISQDETDIINFDKCSRIHFLNPHDRRENCEIYVYLDGISMSIGLYKNEEFAKEVFVNIQKNYLWSISNIGTTNVFKMPKDET